MASVEQLSRPITSLDHGFSVVRFPLAADSGILKIVDRLRAPFLDRTKDGLNVSRFFEPENPTCPIKPPALHLLRRNELTGQEWSSDFSRFAGQAISKALRESPELNSNLSVTFNKWGRKRTANTNLDFYFLEPNRKSYEAINEDRANFLDCFEDHLAEPGKEELSWDDADTDFTVVTGYRLPKCSANDIGQRIGNLLSVNVVFGPAQILLPEQRRPIDSSLFLRS